MKKWIALFMTILLGLGLLVPALAAGGDGSRKKPPIAIDTTAEVSLKVNFVVKNGRDETRTLRFEGIDVRIYRVAEVSLDAMYTVTGEFTRVWPAGVDLNQTMDGKTLLDLAGTLKSQAYENQIEPTAAGKTGADGSVTFEDLEQGLYLVVAQPAWVGEDSYVPMASLISLPTANADRTAWVYDAETYIKPTVNLYDEPESTPTPTPTPEPSPSPTPSEEPSPSPTPSEEPSPSPTPSEEPSPSPTPSEEPSPSPEPSETPGPGTMHITAHKMWDDKDDEAEKRPDEIVVHLWCDGEQYDEVILSEENGWTYGWDDLPSGHDWIISERRVSGYMLSLNRAGATYLMTNTFDEELYELDESGVPRGRRIDDEEEYEEFGDEVPRGRLAQTGMIWWPVMLLAGAGILCCMVGFLILRKRSE